MNKLVWLLLYFLVVGIALFFITQGTDIIVASSIFLLIFAVQVQVSSRLDYRIKKLEKQLEGLTYEKA